jgi:type IV pilus assembly protein PilO
MSTAAMIPPPNSSSLERRVPQLTERARSLMTTMNLHFAGVALLVLLDLYLIVHLIFVFQGLSANNSVALDQQRVDLRSAEIAAQPLRGLDKKLLISTADADTFYATRLPYAISEVATEMGALYKRENVRQTRTQYAYAPVLKGNDSLTEVKMDVSVSGDYRPIVQFINALERDKVFFLINTINLTGQQTGQVNLRIRLTTYLRDPRAGELTEELIAPSETSPETPAGGQP